MRECHGSDLRTEKRQPRVKLSEWKPSKDRSLERSVVEPGAKMHMTGEPASNQMSEGRRGRSEGGGGEVRNASGQLK